MDTNNLLQLIQQTYMSNSNQIARAEAQLMIFMSKQNKYRGYNEMQKLLANQSIDHQIKEAICSIIEASVNKFIDETIRMKQENDDAIIQKTVMLKVEHIFDNEAIDSQYKPKIAQLFLRLFHLISPDSSSRLFGKATFQFNIKKPLLGLLLLQSFDHKKPHQRFRSICYQEGFPILFAQFIKQIKADCEIRIKDQFLRVIHDLIVTITFQKYQKFIKSLLLSSNFIEIFEIALTNPWSEQCQIYMYEISAKIGKTIGKWRQVEVYKHLITLIESFAKKQFIAFIQKEQQIVNYYYNYKCLPQQNFNKLICKLNLFCGCLEYKILDVPQITFPIFFTSFLFPIYLRMQRLLMTNTESNLDEVFQRLDNCCFDMTSQCQQVLQNKLIYIICKRNQDSLIILRQLIYGFFNQYLPSVAQDIQRIEIFYDASKGHSFWAMLQISDQEKIKIVLLLMSLQVKLLCTNHQILEFLQQFLYFNWQKIVRIGNQTLFYFLYFYLNYVDDIFSQNWSISKDIIKLLDLPNLAMVIEVLIKRIINLKIEMSVDHQDVATEINYILQKSQNRWLQEYQTSLTTIFKRFPSLISTSMADQIMKVLLLAIRQNRNSFIQNKQLIIQYFNLPHSNLSRLENLNIIFSTAKQLNFILQYSSELLQIIASVIKTTKKIDLNCLKYIFLMEIEANSIESMLATNTINQINSDADLLNQHLLPSLLKQMNIYSILIIHNMISLKSDLLTFSSVQSIIAVSYQTCKQNQFKFDYLTGKIKLNFLLLFTYCWQKTNQILQKTHWNVVEEKNSRFLDQTQIRQRQRYHHLRYRNEQISDEQINPFRIETFLDQIYSQVYRKQNSYRCNYDAKRMVILTLNLLDNHLNNQYQLKYANVSFIAAFLNLKRLYNCQKKNQEIDSDDSLCEVDETEKKIRIIDKAIAVMPSLPLFQNIDCFELFQQFVNKLNKSQSSREWLQQIKKNGLTEPQFLVWNEIMNVRSINKLNRRINKIKRIKIDQ